MFLQASSARPLAPETDKNDGIESRASALVNPASGIANDYLNIFNEIIMLVENYPSVPEFAEDILAWRPVSYAEYWKNSNLPGRETALQAYGATSQALRRAFEAILDEIGELAEKARETVKYSEKYPEMLGYTADSYGDIAGYMNACLARATYIVNYGAVQPIDDPQLRIDRLMARRGDKPRRSTDVR